jgi:hypothetical protein
MRVLTGRMLQPRGTQGQKKASAQIHTFSEHYKGLFTLYAQCRRGLSIRLLVGGRDAFETSIISRDLIPRQVRGTIAAASQAAPSSRVELAALSCEVPHLLCTLLFLSSTVIPVSYSIHCF